MITIMRIRTTGQTGEAIESANGFHSLIVKDPTTDDRRTVQVARGEAELVSINGWRVDNAGRRIN